MHVRFKKTSDWRGVANLHVTGTFAEIVHRVLDARCGLFAVEHVKFSHHV